MTTAVKQNRLVTKNRETGLTEIIEQHDLEMLPWGFRFFVNGELEAYKAAYCYRDSKHGVKVEFARGLKRWMVTVFNSSAKSLGIDGAN